MPPPGPDRQADQVVIEEGTTVDDELVEAFAALVPQLSSSPPPGREELTEIARSEAAILLLARNGRGALVGSLTLVLFRVPTGLRAWIEDVVVDEKARGGGVGEALVQAALSRATSAGARSVDLTSRPSRDAANRLYQRLGFEARATNVYRWNSDHGPGSPGAPPPSGGS
jgi:ribosomal protein S18 acetylase RimI-like enzyme